MAVTALDITSAYASIAAAPWLQQNKVDDGPELSEADSIANFTAFFGNSVCKFILQTAEIAAGMRSILVALNGYTTVTLPAATTAGTLAYDTTRQRLVVANGATWDSVQVEAPAAPSVGPEVVYEVDFTTLATQSFLGSGDGTYSLDGKDWEVANTANAGGVFGITSNGLEATAVDSGFQYTSSTQTAPYARIKLSELIPDFDPTGSYAVEVHVTFAGDDDDEQCTLGLHGPSGTPTGASARMFNVSRGINTSSGFLFVRHNTTALELDAAVGGSSVNVIGLSWDGAGGLNNGSRWGVYSGGWPEPSAMTPGPAVSQNTLTQSIMNHPDCYLVIAWQSPNGAGNNHAGAFHRLRVWRYA